jgi:hypothetical protein
MTPGEFMNSWSKDGDSMQIRRAMNGVRRRPRLAGALGLLMCAGALASAPSALATTDLTWSGTSASSIDWSNTSNWGGATATGPFGQLTFPYLAGTCDTDAPADACYSSTDDLGAAATVGNLTIDDNSPYDLESQAPGTDTLNLDPTTGDGLDATASGAGVGGPALIDIPVTLGDSQTWTISGDGQPGETGVLVDQASVSSNVTVDLEDAGALYTNSFGESGTLTATGDGSGALVLGGSQAQLPNVILNQGTSFIDLSPDATSGEITPTTEPGPDGFLFAIGGTGAPDGTLAVNGWEDLGPDVALSLNIDDNGSTPSTDYSQLTTTGGVDFDGALIGLNQGNTAAQGCATLTPGETYTLVSSPDPLTGNITYYDTTNAARTLGSGETSAAIPLSECTDGATTVSSFATLTYGTYAITATIVAASSGTEPGGGSTGTSAPRLFGSAPVISGTAIVGQTLTVTSNGSFDGTPTPTYTYRWLACGSACTPITGATGQTYKILSTQVGEKIEVEVIANNSAGSATATSNQIGPVLAVPVVVKTDTGTSTGNGPNPKTVESAISKLLTPTGKLAKIPALLKYGGYTFTFKAPSGGKATLSWTATVKHKKINVASASFSLKRKGTDKLKLKLSSAGRSLLKHSSHLTLHVTATFTPTGHSKVGSTTNIKLG